MKGMSAILFAAAVSLSGLAAEKPNVVFIITDDQSWDSLGFMGGQVHTPRLDRMAQDGLWLTDFNVTSTVCSPSRYSFMTGRYAGRCTGERFMREHPPGDQTQIENIGEIEPDRWNLAKVLQQNGYKTGFVGKSHLLNHHWINGSWEAAGLEPYAKDADPRDPEVNAKMHRNHRKWCEAMMPYGFDYVDGYYCANLKELRNDALNVHNLDWSVSKAFEFLEASKDEPFFLYFATTLHHGPAPWVNKFSLDADPRMTGEGFVAEGFNVLPPRADVLRRNREAGFEDNKAFALWLDDGVGAILDKIDALGLTEDTLVVFVPDHGSYRHGKATLHDYGMRVPMLLQWKGRIQANTTYDGLVANIDFAPTVLDLCGITPPADYAFDGVSFKDVLFGSQEPIRDVLFGELGHSRGVKTKEWKYIAVRYPEELQARIDRGETFRGFDGSEMELPYLTRNSHLGYHASQANPHYFEYDQLYSLKNDPEETENVFAQYPEVGRDMQKKLAAELAQFEGRPFAEFTGGKAPAPKTITRRAAGAAVALAKMLPLKATREAQVSAIEVAGRSGWTSACRTGKPSYFYFRADDTSFRNGARPNVTLAVTYLDRGNTGMTVQYDSSDAAHNPNHPKGAGVFKKAGGAAVRESGAWKTAEFHLTDAQFSGRCNGADLRIGFAQPDRAPVIADVTLKAAE
jgi:arylsulfatase A-like enzyme